MSTTKLTDAEVHDLVIQRIRSRTREEWQARLNEAAALFGRDEETVASHASASSPGKYRLRDLRGHRPARLSDIVLSGTRPKAAKASKKKYSVAAT